MSLNTGERRVPAELERTQVGDRLVSGRCRGWTGLRR